VPQLTVPLHTPDENRVYYSYDNKIQEDKILKDEMVEEQIRVTRRRGKRRKQLLDDLKETRWYWKLKEEAPDCTVWRTRFGRGYGPVVTMNE
jgi:hypothetical protein